MEYHLISVDDNRTRKLFHDVMRGIYKNDKNFVCPPDAFIESIFTPAKNIFFTHGEATRWILLDENNKPVGRVAAFINRKKAFTFQVPTGGMGFFECIHDYKEFFEKYGFTTYFEQVTNLLDLTKPFPERFWKIADWVRQKPEYHFKHFSYSESEKFIADFQEVYNDAWQFHENFTPTDPEAIRSVLTEMKSLLVPEFIWFAYHGDTPIAFEVMLPDINQMLRYFNGKINLWGKLKVGLAGKKRIFTRTRITIMGVKPQYQKSGIESALFWHMNKVMKKNPQYKEVELSWVGDFNPKMRMLHEAVGGVFSKRHVTYRKYFTATPAAGRSTIIPVDTRGKNSSPK